MLATKQFLVPIVFHNIFLFLHTMEANEDHTLFTIIVCSTKEKLIHDLRVSKWQNFHFWVNYPFKESHVTVYLC